MKVELSRSILVLKGLRSRAWWAPINPVGGPIGFKTQSKQIDAQRSRQKAQWGKHKEENQGQNDANDRFTNPSYDWRHCIPNFFAPLT